ncbi:signal peptidase II [Christensenellaceae bacterium OttesenSCG-928-L17]|nr:signal peptidase II [Christensenellaceae bacterium OttesenSCG-928-L17]
MLEAIIVLLIVGLDQFTKHLTDLYLMPLGTSVPLIENVVHFTSAHNTGAAFGMLKGGRWFFLVVTVLVCGAMVFFLIKMRGRLHRMLRVILALLLAGAIGNLIDRVYLGYVRDMIELRFIHFAIFNVADSAVTIGVVLLIFDVFFGKSKAFFDDSAKKEPLTVAGDVEAASNTEQSAAHTNDAPEQAAQPEQTGEDG